MTEQTISTDIGGNSPEALAAFERHTGLKTQALRLVPVDETDGQ